MSQTQQLAEWILSTHIENVPDDVRNEARRALVNFVGCALGGSHDEAVDIAIRALGPYFGPPTASILGRTERLDPLHAALMNGISSHVYDFDDTTPKNYMHPTSPVASALFAYASAHPVSGRDFAEAFIIGFEAEMRIGNAVYPAHYDVGWHITGTAGVFGAAIAIGKLIKLTEEQMIWNIGLAATQAAGIREMFGSMAKSFHPGRAAQNGYAGALLAQAGFTAGVHGLEGPRGFAAVQAAHYDLSKITAGLDSEWELRANTYKPFPCGIVNHPTIDGAIQIHNEHHPAPRDIAAVRLRVAPLVMDLCNQTNITKGLQGKFSVYHGAAVGLVRGKAGIQEYTDAAVNNPDIKYVREHTTATGDATVTEDQARIEVVLIDGRTLHKFVAQSLGNIHRPLSDDQLSAKFLDQAPGYEAALKNCWQVDKLENIATLIASGIPI
jgi:2-methylcitrate dehydratase PrpD